MGIKITSRRTVRAELDLGGDAPSKITATCRCMTAGERAEFRAAAAAAQARAAATGAGDAAALVGLGGEGDFLALATRLWVRCVTDLADDAGDPVEFDGKVWRDMTEEERLAAAGMGLEGLLSAVFNKVNQQAEARLLGK